MHRPHQIRGISDAPDQLATMPTTKLFGHPNSFAFHLDRQHEILTRIVANHDPKLSRPVVNNWPAARRLRTVITQLTANSHRPSVTRDP